MQETENQLCPSCGRSNPPGVKYCRFCAASMSERIHTSLITMGVFALLVLAVIHLGAAMIYTPRYTPIPKLLSEMNFEKVRVLGRVTNVSVTKAAYNSRQVRIELEDPDSPFVNTDLRKITARLEGEAAADFVNQKHTIRKGDLVEVAASLFAGEGYRHLSVSSPKFIDVKERASAQAPAAEGVEIEATVPELLGSPETYRGKNVRVPRAIIAGTGDGTPVLRIADAEQPDRELTVFGYEGTKFTVGENVSVRGKFFFYETKGYWEIKTPFGDDEAVAAVRKHAAR